MLLKLNPAVTKLNLYDIVHTLGVASDLSHCETKATVTGFVGEDQLEASLVGAEIVVIPAGVPRKPGMTRLVSGLDNLNHKHLLHCTVLLHVSFKQH